MTNSHPLILSIDLDEWFHCRWATGGQTSLWPSISDCLREHYGSDTPAGEIIEPTRKILHALEQAGARATFFILGEVASWYPDLVEEIATRGHEIGCHGMHHYYPTLVPRDEFARELAQARQILRDISGQPVNGFRAPNLVIPDWLQDVLIDQGFRYDSSVCPSRKIQGKYAGQIGASCNPYRVSKSSLLKPGKEPFVEIPIPVFPLLRIPGGVSIATRVFGWNWTRITLDTALRTGATCYYMHPYEFNRKPDISGLKLRDHLFCRRLGPYMERVLDRILQTYSGRIIAAEDYLSTVLAGSPA
jgi:peptidoglycan/xylan/chitin deacetylase (PgdA/CDA1 family)